MPEREELAAWLWLVHSAGIGAESARRLLKTFGSPQAAVGASDTALLQVLTSRQAREIRNRPAGHEARLEATCRWLESPRPGAPRHVLTLGDAAYPALLLQTCDPPTLLYACGRVELLAAPSIAIVGSRRATPQGLDNARGFAMHLSEQGLTIVSGLALGIDAAAHEGGLAGPGGSVAFVGTGLDVDYPRRNARLAERLQHEGLVLSEYSLGTPPLAANFPRRNRLIAGVSLGTLVVEATVQSGSLITARLAAEAGREVFAIPGSIHAPQARGCHQLIQQGAKLVGTAADILDELAHALPQAAPGTRSRPGHPPASHPPSADDRLLDALGHDPVTIDALAARTGWPLERLAAKLLDLELRGQVLRLPGSLFQRRGQA